MLHWNLHAYKAMDRVYNIRLLTKLTTNWLRNKFSSKFRNKWLVNHINDSLWDP